MATAHPVTRMGVTSLLHTRTHSSWPLCSSARPLRIPVSARRHQYSTAADRVTSDKQHQDSSGVHQVDSKKPKVGDYMDSAPLSYTSSSATNFKLNLLFLAATGVAGGGALLIFSKLRPLLAEEEREKSRNPGSDFAPSIEDTETRHPNRIVRVWNALARFFHNFIFEPIGTAKRFIVLFSLFFPVLLTIPMLFVGRKGAATTQKRKGSNGDDYVSKNEEDRWGAIWWYGFLVKQMERAGPTFIKVSDAHQ